MEMYHHHLLFLFTPKLSRRSEKGRDKASRRWCVVVYCDRYHVTTTALHRASPRQIKCLLKSNLYYSLSQLTVAFNLSCESETSESWTNINCLSLLLRIRVSDFCLNRRNASEDLFTVLMYNNDAPYIVFGVDF